jgi:site-specific DNA recombinase
LGAGIYLCGVCGGPLSTHSGGRYRCRAGGHLTRMGASIDTFVRAVIRGRLARPDVADLLAVPDTDGAKLLSVQIAGLRARLGKIEADYDADLIDGRRFAVATEKVQAELTRAGRRARVCARSQGPRSGVRQCPSGGAARRPGSTGHRDSATRTTGPQVRP